MNNYKKNGKNKNVDYYRKRNRNEEYDNNGGNNGYNAAGIRKKERQALELEEISIADFMDAVAAVSPKTVATFFTYVAKWKKSLAVDDAVRNRRKLGHKLSYAAGRKGAGWFAATRRTYAANAFDALADMDKEYSSLTGRHIKGFTSYRNSTQKEQFMLRFEMEYSDYKKKHPHKLSSELTNCSAG